MIRHRWSHAVMASAIVIGGIITPQHASLANQALGPPPVLLRVGEYGTVMAITDPVVARNPQEYRLNVVFHNDNSGLDEVILQGAPLTCSEQAGYAICEVQGTSSDALVPDDVVGSTVRAYLVDSKRQAGPYSERDTHAVEVSSLAKAQGRRLSRENVETAAKRMFGITYDDVARGSLIGWGQGAWDTASCQLLGMINPISRITGPLKTAIDITKAKSLRALSSIQKAELVSIATGNSSLAKLTNRRLGDPFCPNSQSIVKWASAALASTRGDTPSYAFARVRGPERYGVIDRLKLQSPCTVEIGVGPNARSISWFPYRVDAPIIEPASCQALKNKFISPDSVFGPFQPVATAPTTGICAEDLPSPRLELPAEATLTPTVARTISEWIVNTKCFWSVSVESAPNATARAKKYGDDVFRSIHEIGYVFADGTTFKVPAGIRASVSGIAPNRIVIVGNFFLP